MSEDNARPRPLDSSLLKLTEQEAEFLKSQTGIQDDEALKVHIIKVQKRAYEILRPYGCIHNFSFTRLKISRLPAYGRVLQLRNTRHDAIFLDIGSGFGNDIRKAVADGWPVKNAIASDVSRAICKEFWNQGHELFKSTPETFPAGFVAGDAFSPAMIEPREPFYSPSPSPRPADLGNLTSLTPLQGHTSVIHASLLFHLFDEEKQLALAKQLATLLSPEPGSIMFGVHGGLETKGTRPSYNGREMLCHSPESWLELWDGIVFRKGSVRVEAILVESEGPYNEPSAWKYLVLVWSVTRL